MSYSHVLLLLKVKCSFCKQKYLQTFCKQKCLQYICSVNQSNNVTF
nr:MAG TPA: 33 kDa chaperonin [Caudoviricetes sp.]